MAKRDLETDTYPKVVMQLSKVKHQLNQATMMHKNAYTFW